MVSLYRTQGTLRFGREFYYKNGTYNGCPLGTKYNFLFEIIQLFTFSKQFLSKGDEQCRLKRYDGATPTFWEFIKYIINGGTQDPHWISIHSSCRLVSLNAFTDTDFPSNLLTSHDQNFRESSVT